MQQRVKNKNQIHCQIEGFGRKIVKQILYKKTIILETDLVQVGFDNSKKPGTF